MTAPFNRPLRATIICLACLAPVSAQDPASSDNPDQFAFAMLPFVGSGTVGVAQDPAGAQIPAEEFYFWDRERPDRDAPYGVPNTQVVDVGQWLVSYTFNFEYSKGLRDSRDNLGLAQLAPNFTDAPTKLKAQTHSIQALYGWDGDWTVFATLPVHAREMDNVNRTMGSYTTRSSGLGDLVLGGIRTVGEIDDELIRLHFGLEIPTGSIDETDADAAGVERVLPFAMQPGTGTFNLRPGVTYMAQMETWSWGLQGNGRVHIDKNSDDWAIGDSFDMTVWGQRPFNEDVSGSLRLQGESRGDYHGVSTALDPNGMTGPNPLRNPIESGKNQGGTRIDLLGGLNFDLTRVPDKTNRIAIEFGVPIDQWVDGPQLSLDWLATFGWQLSF